MTISSMPWVKLYTDILDDCKVGQLSDTLKWRFVSLICLAGECDANGCLMNGTGAMSAASIAWRLRITAEEIKKDLAALSSAGLVVQENDIWTVTNFAKRQGRAQYEKREQWRERKDRSQASGDAQPDASQDDASRENHAGITRLEKSREEKIKTKKREGEKSAKSPPPPAIAVYRSKANTFPIKALWQEIADTVGDDPANLSRWGDVVYAYVRCGWNRSNVGAMLDYYRRGETPHTGKDKSNAACVNHSQKYTDADRAAAAEVNRRNADRAAERAVQRAAIVPAV